jgi:hypothetical protein
VAPALHSFTISLGHDVVRIVGILFDSHVDLRKLILKNCYLDNDSTVILTKIVARYPELETLSLQDCQPLHSAAYSLIPQLKKLSELIVPSTEVRYVYVKLLETHVCICERM